MESKQQLNKEEVRQLAERVLLGRLQRLQVLGHTDKGRVVVFVPRLDNEDELRWRNLS